MAIRRAALLAAVALLSGGAGFAASTALEPDRTPTYEERVVDELIRTARRTALTPRAGDQAFAELLPLVEGRGFPLVVVGRVVKAEPDYGYGQVSEPCDTPESSGSSCVGRTEWRAIPVTDGRATEVIIRASVEVDEVLARNQTTAKTAPSRFEFEWIVSGPATPSPIDADEVSDALVALGRAVWVITEPGANTTYASNETDADLAGIAWAPFGIALVDNEDRVQPLAGPIPPTIDTLEELRRALEAGRS